MATGLFTVKATISPDREEAFNEWYNHAHIPDVLKFEGVVGARRYKAIDPKAANAGVLSEDRFQYITVYEFESEEALHRFLRSEHVGWLTKEYDAEFGTVSERHRSAYVQVGP